MRGPSVRNLACLAVVLLIALALRLWGLAYDLPYVYHPDEPGLASMSLRILQTGDLNPRFFHYPSLFFYINAAAYLPYYFVGRYAGAFQTPTDILHPYGPAMAVTRAPMPTMMLYARAITVLFGVGTVGLTHLAGKRLTGSTSVSLLAALFVAVLPPNVAHSRYVTPDTFVTFFALAAFVSAAWLLKGRGLMPTYVLAGALVGLTASTKYNGGLVILPLVTAHMMRARQKALADPKLLVAILAAGLGFVVATPYALLDHQLFLRDLNFDRQHYSQGHAGMEGNTLRWYITYMSKTAVPVYALAIAESIRGFWVRSKESILISVFPLTYFAFISSFTVRNDRTLLPSTPFLALLAAVLLVHLFQTARRLALRNQCVTGLVLASVLVSLAVAVPLSATVREAVRLSVVDSRETARLWISVNLPVGSQIAIEAYSPFVEPTVHVVRGFNSIIDQEPEWYVENGFEYLVFSEGMYGRYYREPGRYAAEIARYDLFFAEFPLVKKFDDGGFEVRIHATRRCQ